MPDTQFSLGVATKFAVVDAASSGDNTLVAAVTGKKIRVLAGMLTMTGTAVTVRFESGAGGTALTGQMTPTQGSTITLPYCPVGHFETAAAALLNLELGGAQSVDGYIVYCEV
jgi:regulator of RNase E activity RraA